MNIKNLWESETNNEVFAKWHKKCPKDNVIDKNINFYVKIL